MQNTEGWREIALRVEWFGVFFLCSSVFSQEEIALIHGDLLF